MIVDVNVNVGRWPFRRLPHDETPKLVKKLRTKQVVQAWTGSFDGLLHKDIGGTNKRLADECRQHGDGLLVPFGSVNPTLPDWKEDLRRCHEVHNMPGIRLHPDYHGYTLDDPVFAELLALAEKRGLLVQLSLRMEDARTHHSLMPVPPVNPSPLEKLVAARPKLRLVILNGMRSLRGATLTRLAAAGHVSFEIATLESVGGIAKLLKLVPLDRVLFGSHFPFFYFESALLKLRESALDESQTQAITHQNAQTLLDQHA